MSKRIYTGNLPWSVTKAKLEELFSPYGEIEDAIVIADKYTGRSRGFGFVTYKKDADADKAIKEMSEKDVEGRKLIVKEARPQRDQEENQPEGKEEKDREENKKVEVKEAEKPKESE